MKTYRAVAVSLLLLSVIAGRAQAVSTDILLHEGTIEENATSYTLDYVYFDVLNPGILAFTLRAVTPTMDPFLLLFKDTGTLELASQLAFDNNSATGGYGFDSFIDVSSPALPVGSYVLVIDNWLSDFGNNFPHSPPPATAGKNASGAGGAYRLYGDFGEVSNVQITKIQDGNLDGSFTTGVPEPSIVALVGLGLLGWGLVPGVRPSTRNADGR